MPKTRNKRKISPQILTGVFADIAALPEQDEANKKLKLFLNALALSFANADTASKLLPGSYADFSDNAIGTANPNGQFTPISEQAAAAQRGAFITQGTALFNTADPEEKRTAINNLCKIGETSSSSKADTIRLFQSNSWIKKLNTYVDTNPQAEVARAIAKAIAPEEPAANLNAAAASSPIPTIKDRIAALQQQKSAAEKNQINTGRDVLGDVEDLERKNAAAASSIPPKKTGMKHGTQSPKQPSPTAHSPSSAGSRSPSPFNPGAAIAQRKREEKAAADAATQQAQQAQEKAEREQAKRRAGARSNVETKQAEAKEEADKQNRIMKKTGAYKELDEATKELLGKITNFKIPESEAGKDRAFKQDIPALQNRLNAINSNRRFQPLLALLPEGQTIQAIQSQLDRLNQKLHGNELDPNALRAAAAHTPKKTGHKRSGSSDSYTDEEGLLDDLTGSPIVTPTAADKLGGNDEQKKVDVVVPPLDLSVSDAPSLPGTPAHVSDLDLQPTDVINLDIGNRQRKHREALEESGKPIDLTQSLELNPNQLTADAKKLLQNMQSYIQSFIDRTAGTGLLTSEQLNNLANNGIQIAKKFFRDKPEYFSVDLVTQNFVKAAYVSNVKDLLEINGQPSAPLPTISAIDELPIKRDTLPKLFLASGSNKLTEWRKTADGLVPQLPLELQNLMRNHRQKTPPKQQEASLPFPPVSPVLSIDPSLQVYLDDEKTPESTPLSAFFNNLTELTTRIQGGIRPDNSLIDPSRWSDPSAIATDYNRDILGALQYEEWMQIPEIRTLEEQLSKLIEAKLQELDQQRAAELAARIHPQNLQIDTSLVFDENDERNNSLSSSPTGISPTPPYLVTPVAQPTPFITPVERIPEPDPSFVLPIPTQQQQQPEEERQNLPNIQRLLGQVENTQNMLHIAQRLDGVDQELIDILQELFQQHQNSYMDIVAPSGAISFDETGNINWSKFKLDTDEGRELWNKMIELHNSLGQAQLNLNTKNMEAELQQARDPRSPLATDLESRFAQLRQDLRGELGRYNRQRDQYSPEVQHYINGLEQRVANLENLYTQLAARIAAQPAAPAVPQAGTTDPLLLHILEQVHALHGKVNLLQQQIQNQPQPNESKYAEPVQNRTAENNPQIAELMKQIAELQGQIHRLPAPQTPANDNARLLEELALMRQRIERLQQPIVQMPQPVSPAPPVASGINPAVLALLNQMQQAHEQQMTVMTDMMRVLQQQLAVQQQPIPPVQQPQQPPVQQQPQQQQVIQPPPAAVAVNPNQAAADALCAEILQHNQHAQDGITQIANHRAANTNKFVDQAVLQQPEITLQNIVPVIAGLPARIAAFPDQTLIAPVNAALATLQQSRADLFSGIDLAKQELKTKLTADTQALINEMDTLRKTLDPNDPTHSTNFVVDPTGAKPTTINDKTAFLASIKTKLDGYPAKITDLTNRAAALPSPISETAQLQPTLNNLNTAFAGANLLGATPAPPTPINVDRLLRNFALFTGLNSDIAIAHSQANRLKDVAMLLSAGDDISATEIARHIKELNKLSSVQKIEAAIKNKHVLEDLTKAKDYLDSLPETPEIKIQKDRLDTYYQLFTEVPKAKNPVAIACNTTQYMEFSNEEPLESAWSKMLVANDQQSYQQAMQQSQGPSDFSFKTKFTGKMPASNYALGIEYLSKVGDPEIDAIPNLDERMQAVRDSAITFHITRSNNGECIINPHVAPAMNPGIFLAKKANAVLESFVDLDRHKGLDAKGPSDFLNDIRKELLRLRQNFDPEFVKPIIEKYHANKSFMTRLSNLTKIGDIPVRYDFKVAKNHKNRGENDVEALTRILCDEHKKVLTIDKLTKIAIIYLNKIVAQNLLAGTPSTHITLSISNLSEAALLDKSLTDLPPSLDGRFAAIFKQVCLANGHACTDTTNYRYTLTNEEAREYQASFKAHNPAHYTATSAVRKKEHLESQQPTPLQIQETPIMQEIHAIHRTEHNELLTTKNTAIQSITRNTDLTRDAKVAETNRIEDRYKKDSKQLHDQQQDEVKPYTELYNHQQKFLKQIYDEEKGLHKQYKIALEDIESRQRNGKLSVTDAQLEKQHKKTDLDTGITNLQTEFDNQKTFFSNELHNLHVTRENRKNLNVNQAIRALQRHPAPEFQKYVAISNQSPGIFTNTTHTNNPTISAILSAQNAKLLQLAKDHSRQRHNIDYQNFLNRDALKVIDRIDLSSNHPRALAEENQHQTNLNAARLKQASELEKEAQTFNAQLKLISNQVKYSTPKILETEQEVALKELKEYRAGEIKNAMQQLKNDATNDAWKAPYKALADSYDAVEKAQKELHKFEKKFFIDAYKDLQKAIEKAKKEGHEEKSDYVASLIVSKVAADAKKFADEKIPLEAALEQAKTTQKEKLWDFAEKAEAALPKKSAAGTTRPALQVAVAAATDNPVNALEKANNAIMAAHALIAPLGMAVPIATTMAAIKKARTTATDAVKLLSTLPPKYQTDQKAVEDELQHLDTIVIQLERRVAQAHPRQPVQQQQALLQQQQALANLLQQASSLDRAVDTLAQHEKAEADKLKGQPPQAYRQLAQQILLTQQQQLAKATELLQKLSALPPDNAAQQLHSLLTQTVQKLEPRIAEKNKFLTDLKQQVLQQQQPSGNAAALTAQQQTAQLAVQRQLQQEINDLQAALVLQQQAQQPPQQPSGNAAALTAQQAAQLAVQRQLQQEINDLQAALTLQQQQAQQPPQQQPPHRSNIHGSEDSLSSLSSAAPLATIVAQPGGPKPEDADDLSAQRDYSQNNDENVDWSEFDINDLLRDRDDEKKGPSNR